MSRCTLLFTPTLYKDLNLYTLYGSMDCLWLGISYGCQVHEILLQFCLIPGFMHAHPPNPYNAMTTQCHSLLFPFANKCKSWEVWPVSIKRREKYTDHTCKRGHIHINLRCTFVELSKVLVVKDGKDELLVFVQILHHPNSPPPLPHQSEWQQWNLQQEWIDR